MNTATNEPSLPNLKKGQKLNKKAAKNLRKIRQKPKKKLHVPAKLSDETLKSKILQATEKPLSANRTLLANATLQTKTESSMMTTSLCKSFNSSPNSPGLRA